MVTLEYYIAQQWKMILRLTFPRHQTLSHDGAQAKLFIGYWEGDIIDVSLKSWGRETLQKCLPPSGGEGDITKNVSLQVRERETLQINVSLTKKRVTQRNYKKYF